MKFQDFAANKWLSFDGRKVSYYFPLSRPQFDAAGSDLSPIARLIKDTARDRNCSGKKLTFSFAASRLLQMVCREADKLFRNRYSRPTRSKGLKLRLAMELRDLRRGTLGLGIDIDNNLYDFDFNVTREDYDAATRRKSRIKFFNHVEDMMQCKLLASFTRPLRPGS